MTVSFRALKKEDIEFLRNVLQDSFNSDSELAFGTNTKMGPPGYDDGTLANRIINNTNLTKLSILSHNQTCGILIATKGNPNVIDYFCLDPVYIGKNIGSLAWQAFEKEHPGIWQLETPDFSKRNHHFYEKNGFLKIGEKFYTPESSSYIYRKEI